MSFLISDKCQGIGGGDVVFTIIVCKTPCVNNKKFLNLLLTSFAYTSVCTECTAECGECNDTSFEDLNESQLSQQQSQQ